MDKETVILALCERDRRFAPEAYHFVFEALDYTLAHRGGGRRHVSGAEIMEGARQLALDKFGFLARAVFRQWGVTRTDDYGAIVFNLIGADLLQKTADDRLEDFSGLYDFSEAFDLAFDESLQSVEI